LYFELEVAKTAATNFLNKSQLFSDLQQILVPLIVVRHDKLGGPALLEERRDTFTNKLVRDQAYYRANQE